MPQYHPGNEFHLELAKEKKECVRKWHPSSAFIFLPKKRDEENLSFLSPRLANHSESTLIRQLLCTVKRAKRIGNGSYYNPFEMRCRVEEGCEVLSKRRSVPCVLLSFSLPQKNREEGWPLNTAIRLLTYGLFSEHQRKKLEKGATYTKDVRL